MTRISAALPLSLVATLFASTALADAWVQIEAQPSLTQATKAAQDYATQLPNVMGFELSGRWHAIALGPYATEAEAIATLTQLRAQGLIPRDSYTTDGTEYRTPFFPVGASLTIPEAAPQMADEPVEQVAQPTTEETVPEIVVPQEPLDETPAQARASERELDRDARMALQVALRFAGFYNSSIDGAFGNGTRRAMSAWQEANGHEATGVLTTKQRNAVLAAYQAVVDKLSITRVTDETAGIEIDLPLGLVTFDAYTPPFAKFKSKDDSGVQVMLISQSGDEDTLGGLYEILQTLKIVPVEGERSRKKTSFVLTGSDAEITTHIEATLTGGTVKGWALIWPTSGDQTQRKMALDAMKQSFTPLRDAVLPDAYGEGAEQNIDLLSGLEIRRAERNGTGFYVDKEGRVATSAATIESCARVTLDDTYDATVVATDDGLALLAPTETLAPIAFAAFDSRLPRLQADVTAAGYAYDGRLGTPTLNFGTMQEHAGLNGEADVLRLNMSTRPSEAGAPVMATTGGVIGMLATLDTGSRALPEDVAFAYDMEKLATFLSGNGVSIAAAQSDTDLSSEELISQARDMTVLVSCWN
ncbi:trypsin-like peptidase domain-containing protein [Celeribacter sp.]|uniref:trypsin-like peptidase domain-containing protein n=1 Tax=Celeribacter sp. TaxID=1890673 RepID=UPI003A8F1A2F